jgi:hypothetical protein
LEYGFDQIKNTTEGAVAEFYRGGSPMGGVRWLILLAVATVTVATAGNAVAQNSVLPASSSDSYNPIKLKLEDFTNPHTSGIVLPLGLNYDHETKNLVMPLDAQKLWGVGMNLDIGHVKEFSTDNWLGIEPKKAPGVVLQRNF